MEPSLPELLPNTGPLARASTDGDLDTVKSILEACDICVSEQDKQKAMRVAVENEDLMTVSYLLTKGIKPTSDDFVNAVKKISYPILQIFLDDGYEINTPHRDDYPPALAQVGSPHQSYHTLT
jgi:hypothetical protein